MVHEIGTAALWLGVAAGAAFVVLYHVSARWWRSAEGRHLMSFTAALAMILGWLAYRSLTAPRALSQVEEYGRTVVYVVVAGLLLWRLELLLRRQILPGLRRKERMK